MVRKIDTMKKLKLFGDFLMLGTFLMLLWLFFSAYLSNDFSTIVHINTYGEAHIEMIILVFFLLPLFLLTTVLSFLDWRQTWKARKRILHQRYLLLGATSPYQDLFEGVLVCPRCDGRFEVEMPYPSGTTTCPTCGLVGSYVPNEEEYEFEGNNRPTVRIIKNIRR